MSIEYLGLSEINGPLVVLEGVENVAYEEMVEFTIENGTKKLGRIIAAYEDKEMCIRDSCCTFLSLYN